MEEPLVTVIVTDFVGPLTQQVRGRRGDPAAGDSFRDDMTMLDVMIAVGGLTEFAAGNRATLVRTAAGQEEEYRVRLDDLVRDGDISANVAMRPGDVVIIPESASFGCPGSCPQCGCTAAPEGSRSAAQAMEQLGRQVPRQENGRHLQPMGAQIEHPDGDAAARARLVR